MPVSHTLAVRQRVTAAFLKSDDLVTGCGGLDTVSFDAYPRQGRWRVAVSDGCEFEAVENDAEQSGFCFNRVKEGEDHVGPLPKFYECGVCGSMHSVRWDGDCRQDDARFDYEGLDARYGPEGWVEVPMPGSEDALAQREINHRYRRLAPVRPHGLCEYADTCVEHAANRTVSSCKHSSKTSRRRGGR